MKPLEDIYSGRFFKQRHRLNWRAPIVCDAIQKILKPNSVIDVGCATGDLISQFLNISIDAYGIEGSMAAIPYLECPISRVLFHNLCSPLPASFGRQYDLAICFEVAEHIEPEYTCQFVLNLISLSDRILMSAAPPGQAGHHHVNCQVPDYWVNRFQAHKFTRKTEIEDQFKTGLSPWARKKGIKAYYENVLFFEKKRCYD